MITLKFTLSKEDYLNYSYYVYWGQPGNKFRIIQKRLLQFTVYTGLLAVLINYDKQGNVDLRYIIPFILILASIFILPLFAVKRSLAKQVSLLYNNELNNSLFSECTVTFSETGFTSTNDAGELSRKWKAVVKKAENKDYFFLFISTMQAIVIPKRIFKNPGELEQFRKLLLKYLSFDAEIATHLKP